MLEYARTLLGRRAPLVVRGRRFRFDCSGFVSAVHYHAGRDLMVLERNVSRRDISGTELIYLKVKEDGRIFSENPLPGDLVFFDNTYDRNRNGKLDDMFTHIGIVDRILPSGTIEILHLGNAGIGRIHMNLKRPDDYRDEKTGELLNHKLRRRRRTDSRATRYLSSQLFRAFGRLD